MQSIKVILGIVGLIVVVSGLRLLKLSLSVKSYKTYWQHQASLPPAANAITYVALGDSAAQGVGASSAGRGYVGLFAQQLGRQTGRPVHIINISVSGSRLPDLIKNQLPQLRMLKPDIVTVDIGANDIVAKASDADIEKNWSIMLAGLPKGKTIIANVPPLGQADRVSGLNQQLQTKNAAAGITTADIFSELNRRARDPRIYAADFFHPSNTGYRIWCAAFTMQLNKVKIKL